MKMLLAGLMLFGSLSAHAARTCADVAGKAAKSVDAISNDQTLRSIEIKASEKTGSVPSGGETLDTYTVNLVANQDMAAVYEVDLTSTQCVIKAVRYVTGD